jgi:hypothetical protein
MKFWRGFSFRYSLRGLFICTALIALWIGPKAHRARQDRFAVQAIQDVGGHVIYDYMRAQSDEVQGDLAKAIPPGPKWLREFVGDEFFMRPVELVFRKEKITDEGLQQVSLFRDLKAIHLEDRGISDAGVKHLATAETVEYLCLDENRITDEGLLHLIGLQCLNRLDLDFNRITDGGLEHLSRMNNLKTLCIRGNLVTRDGVTRLQRMRPELQIFCDFGSLSIANGTSNAAYGAPFSLSAD